MAEIKLLGLQYGPSLGESLARGAATRAQEQAMQIREQEQERLNREYARQEGGRQAVSSAYQNGELNYPQAIQNASQINPELAMNLEAEARKLSLEESKARYNKLAMFGRMVGQAKNQDQYDQVLQLADKMGLSAGLQPPTQYGPDVAEFWASIGKAADDDLGKAQSSVFAMEQQLNASRIPDVIADIKQRLDNKEFTPQQAADLMFQVNTSKTGALDYAKNQAALLQRVREKTETLPINVKAAAATAEASTKAKIAAESGALQSGEKPFASSVAADIAKTGFMVDNLLTLTNGFSDANVFNRTVVGWVKSPKFDQALKIVDELYSRDQSGAAIARAELIKFKSQVLDTKKMATPEGRQAALNNLNNFVERYLMVGKYITTDEGWYDKYKKTGQRMRESVQGPSEDEFTIEEIK